MPLAPPDPPRACSVDLTLDLAAPRASRALVDLLLPQWGVHDQEVRDSATLVVSELVTHALVQSDDDGRPITLGIELRPDLVRVSVLDHRPPVPAQRGSAPSVEAARGLVVVGRIASRWGVESDPAGRRSYADLPLLPVPLG